MQLNRLKPCFICLLLLSMTFGGFAQGKMPPGSFKLNGHITDQAGEALAGVSVHSKNKTKGTISDDNGNFTVQVSQGETLVFTSLGYQRKEIEIGTQSFLSVVMTPGSSELNEVVVVGYGTTKKKDLTGSVGIANGDAISKKNVSQLSTSLQGLVPGLRVTRNSSIPGNNSATLRIRGITTLGNSNPLILLDGVPIENIDVVNPNDVESISVLKDAASASIYGSRAAAGVILITTKHAHSGQLSLEYSGSIGAGVPTEFPKGVGIKRYMEMINEVAWNDGGNQAGGEFTAYSKDQIDNYIENNATKPEDFPITNWEKVLLNKYAPYTRHNLTMNYGNNTIQFLGAFNYEYTGALYNNRSEERITSRINSNLKITKFLSLETNMYYSHSINKSPTINPIPKAYEFPSVWWPPYWSDGRIAPGRLGTNPWARLNYGGFDDSWENQFIGKFALKLNPIKNLTITGVLMPKVGTSNEKEFIKKVSYYGKDDPNEIQGYINGNTTTNLSEYRPDEKSLTKQLLINYGVNFGSNHNFSFLAGYEDYYERLDNLFSGSQNLALNDFPYLDRGNLSSLLSSGNANEVAYNSYFGRVKYNFAEKYFLQANIRFDGSSRFYKKGRWGSFPSIAVAWVPTEEPFMKNFDLNWLSFLKIRTSLGTLGNDRIGKYPYQAILNFDNALFFNNGQIVSKTTAAQNRFNIRDITWETTRVWDIGIDASFLSDKLSFSGDYYIKKTRNILLPLAIPMFMGFENPDQNAGKMDTKGWDVNLRWSDKIGKLGYSININLSDYRSVMGDLSGTVFLGDQIIEKGSEYDEWYGYLSDGLFQNEDEINKSALFTSAVRPGDVRYKDVSGPNGMPDGRISPEYDKVLLGGSQPRYLYGGNINLNYKGFDLSIMIQGVGKKLSRLLVDQVYQTVQWYNFPSFLDGNYFSEYNSPEKNKKVRYPRLSQASYLGNNYEMSDYWLINGAYFRLKNLSIGYQFPNKLAQSIKMSNLRVFAAVSNLFSIDHFPEGWDPEAVLSSYISRQWTFGVSIKF